MNEYYDLEIKVIILNMTYYLFLGGSVQMHQTPRLNLYLIKINYKKRSLSRRFVSGRTRSTWTRWGIFATVATSWRASTRCGRRSSRLPLTPRTRAKSSTPPRWLFCMIRCSWRTSVFSTPSMGMWWGRAPDGTPWKW